MIGTTGRHGSIRRLSQMALWATAGLFLISSVGAARAQGRVEFGGSCGYQFGGRIQTNAGTVQTADQANFGVTFDLRVSPALQVEISYSRQNGQAAVLPYGDPTIPPFNTAIEYYQVGGLAEVSKSHVRPYVVVTAGVIHTNPEPSGIDSSVYFAFSTGTGIKLFLTPHIGFRLQGRLLFPVISANTGIFVIRGRGYMVSSMVMLLRGDLSAGLFLSF
jgi:hypothetical protein